MRNGNMVSRNSFGTLPLPSADDQYPRRLVPPSKRYAPSATKRALIRKASECKATLPSSASDSENLMFTALPSNNACAILILPIRSSSASQSSILCSPRAALKIVIMKTFSPTPSEKAHPLLSTDNTADLANFAVTAIAVLQSMM